MWHLEQIETLWSHSKYSPEEYAYHAYSFSAACDSLSNLLEHRSHITYFHLQVAFVQVLSLPVQHYMNICKYASLFIHLTCFWFRLSVLMGHLQLNYTRLMCDWHFWYLDCVNCGSDRRVKTAVRPSCSVNRWSSSSCPVDTAQAVSPYQLSNQAETSYCTAC